jgi:hypothetical protein
VFRLRRLRRFAGAATSTLPAQLDNRDLEAVIAGIVAREGWTGEPRRVVVEVGSGGGGGSTVALHRALSAGGSRFRLVGYEGEADLATEAADRWSGVDEVDVVNEYFMQREDIDLTIKPRIAPGDIDAYLPVFDAVARAENFLATAPPGPIDLLFIDSVRYTHLAILHAAQPWLGPKTVVLMEDDIPGYGELAIVESVFELGHVSRHELRRHPWPLVEFRIVA